MPELPEVETVRRGLAPQMEGVRVARLEQRRPDLRFPFPENFAARVEGRCVTTLDRRAKYLLAHLDSGETLVMHLGMSGRFSLSEQPAQRGSKIGTYVHDHGNAATHDHVVLHMANGVSVTYNDARRFGFMLLIPSAELAQHALFKSIGVEPLGEALTPAVLATLAHGRKTDLKAFSVGSAAYRRPRQYLRQRSRPSRTTQPEAASVLSRLAQRDSKPARTTAGAGNQSGAQRSAASRWLDLA